MTYKKILIPTDGSETAQHAIEHGIKLAKALDSRVIGLYIVDISAFVGLHAEGIWQNMKELLKEEGNKTLSAFENSAKKAKVKYEAILREGVPSEDIVKVAEERGVDLIVMGTHGRSGLDRFLLGSVTEKVVRSASCPVMVVRG